MNEKPRETTTATHQPSKIIKFNRHNVNADENGETNENQK